MYNVIIIDDEKPARTRLNIFLKEYSDLNIIGEAQNGKDAIVLINHKKPDLVFLDIQMSNINGFDVIKQINHIPIIIFVTAYDEYAIKAFEVNAIDYLLKPYSKERFKKSIDKALRLLNNKKDFKTDILNFRNELIKKNNYINRIAIKSDYEYEVFNIEEIDFFKIENGLVYLFKDGNKHLVDFNLVQLENKLNPDIFYRTHRNSIVNVKKIEKIDIWGQNKCAIKFKGNQKIFISRDRLKKFKEIMGLKF